MRHYLAEHCDIRLRPDLFDSLSSQGVILPLEGRERALWRILLLAEFERIKGLHDLHDHYRTEIRRVLSDHWLSRYISGLGNFGLTETSFVISKVLNGDK